MRKFAADFLRACTYKERTQILKNKVKGVQKNIEYWILCYQIM